MIHTYCIIYIYVNLDSPDEFRQSVIQVTRGLPSVTTQMTNKCCTTTIIYYI